MKNFFDATADVPPPPLAKTLVAGQMLWPFYRTRQNGMTLSQELVVVDGQTFRHLDQRFYGNHQRRLEKKQFRFLADFEDAAMKHSRRFRPTYMRVLLDQSGSLIANVYHLVPTWFAWLRGARSCKVLEFETQFSDGSWVCTSNAEWAIDLGLPGEINALYMSRSTELELVLSQHRARLYTHLESRQGIQPLHFHSTADFIRAQFEQQSLKDTYRSSPMSFDEGRNGQDVGKAQMNFLRRAA